MKKISIIISIIVVLIFASSIYGYFYYDKNIKHGTPLNQKITLQSDGYYFEGAISEKTMVFWNKNGNFQVAVDSFSSSESALESFKSKIDIYKELLSLNGGSVIKEEATNSFPLFLIKFNDNGNLSISLKKSELIQVINRDRSPEETEKFVKWFVKYWL